MSLCSLETAARSFRSPPTKIAFHTSHRFPWTHRRTDMMEQTGVEGFQQNRKKVRESSWRPNYINPANKVQNCGMIQV